MRVVIIGQGYVGLTIAVGAAGAGHSIIGFDVNQALVDQLNAGKSHIEGITDIDLAGFIAAGAYVASTDPSVVAAYKPAEINPANLESVIPSI